MNWLKKLLGGRPMKLGVYHFFTDTVAGQRVHVYRDIYDRRWLATSRWAWFRVLAKNQDGELIPEAQLIRMIVEEGEECTTPKKQSKTH